MSASRCDQRHGGICLYGADHDDLFLRLLDRIAPGQTKIIPSSRSISHRVAEVMMEAPRTAALP